MQSCAAEHIQVLFLETRRRVQTRIGAPAGTFGTGNIMLGSDFLYFRDDRSTRAPTCIEDSHLAADVIDDIL